MPTFVDLALNNVKKYMDRYEEISNLLEYPEIQGDINLTKKLVCEQASINKIYEISQELKSINELMNEYKDNMLNDKNILNELNFQAKECIDNLNIAVAKLLNNEISFTIEIQTNLEDVKNDLSLLFSSLAKKFNNSFNLTKDGINITSEYLYSLLIKFSGRHTYISSNGEKEYINVFVYENKDNDYILDEKDCLINIFHSSGAGGQNINKVSTAVRIKHILTGIVVTCQDERSQLKNKERAFKTLEKKVNDYYNNSKINSIKEIKEIELGINNKSTITIDNKNKLLKDTRTLKQLKMPINVEEFIDYLVNIK